MKLESKAPPDAAAFTLIEVMIAMGILFMAIFAILGVISNGLRNARALQRKGPDAGMIAAYVSSISASNALTEDVVSGDFGEIYPDYNWEYAPIEWSSNKLYKVDIQINQRTGDRRDNSTISILLYSPNSPPGSLDGIAGAAAGFRR